MKTITEYQPLIFGTLLTHARKRRSRSHHWMRAAALVLPLLYIFAGLKITADTGVMVWDWRFWFMFVPLFLLGERLQLLLAELARE